MPTAPVPPGSRAAHSTVSNPSARSVASRSNSPSELPRPRTSWTTTMYPCRAYHDGCA